MIVDSYGEEKGCKDWTSSPGVRDDLELVVDMCPSSEDCQVKLKGGDDNPKCPGRKSIKVHFDFDEHFRVEVRMVQLHSAVRALATLLAGLACPAGCLLARRL